MSLDRFSLNTATIQKASLTDTVKAAVNAGIPSIGDWREPVAEYGLEASVHLIRDAGLHVSALCRGGLFTGSGELFDQQVSHDNRGAIEITFRAIDEAKALEAECLVLVFVGFLRTLETLCVPARSQHRLSTKSSTTRAKPEFV